ncbi:hypothetical protein ACFQMM_01745 [Saliphagus sp. GCM10025308]
MSVSGLCQICETRSAEERCDNCGALVCQVHYQEGVGLCANCANTVNPNDPDDVDINRL